MSTACASNPFGSEDVCAVVTMWAGKDGHVLDHAENLGEEIRKFLRMSTWMAFVQVLRPS